MNAWTRKHSKQIRENDHKIRSFIFTIGTALAAIGMAITEASEEQVGGIHWNNNSGGAIVINRGYYFRFQD